MALPNILCCAAFICDVPYPFRHLGGITLCWVVWCLPILLLGDRALVLIFWSPRIHYVICHWPDMRWWRQSQATISRILLVNLSILMASFYKHCCWRWPLEIRLMRVGCSCGSEAPLVLVSPYPEMLDFDLKVSCLLLIQQAPTQRFNCFTLDWWPLVESATRSISLWWSILALPILQRISCPFKETYPYDIYHEGDITLVTLGSVLAWFFIKEELFF